MKHVAFSLLPVFALSLTLGFSAEDSTEASPAKKKEKKKTNWEEIDTTEFAGKLESASAAGEKWAGAPETIIIEYAGPLITESGEKMAQRRTIGIRSKGEGVPKKIKVTLTDDGLFDDETKKISIRFHLKRGKKDGSWKLLKAGRATEKWAPPA